MTDKEETTPSTTASTNDGMKQSIEAQQQEQSGNHAEQQSNEQQSYEAEQQGQSGDHAEQQEHSCEQAEQQGDEPEPLDEMTFWDHLEALRWMLVRVFSALGIFIIGGFAFIPWIFEHVIMAPIDNQFFLYRWLAKMSEQVAILPDDLTRPFHVSIINIRLSSQFFLHMSLSFWLALLITFPYLVYEVWKFICPALYENERKSMRFTFVFGTVMFFIGCVVGYSVVFPLTLRFLYNYQLSASISNQLSLDSYMDNFLMLVFMMGIVFELPLVSMLLGKIGILHRGFFSAYRSHAVVALLVVAAFITPSSDPFTLMAVFIPIYILWELSAFLVKPAPKDD